MHASAQTAQSAAAWLQSGKVKMHNRDIYGAIDEFTMAIQLKPNFAKAYYQRGIAYLKYFRKSKPRSRVYQEKARMDFMKAKELGMIVEQNYLDESEDR
jgi:Flp pilus assembly protein TadD